MNHRALASLNHRIIGLRVASATGLIRFGRGYRDDVHGLFVFDFDGTIAPIADDPARAIAHPAALSAMHSIAARGHTVAVLSGRPVSFLRRRLPSSIPKLVGLYGLQWTDGDEIVESDAATRWRPQLARAHTLLVRALPGLLIEDKDGLAVAAHWRTAPSRAAEATATAMEVAAEFGLAYRFGRQTVEILPPEGADKAVAMARLSADASAITYAGDDEADVGVMEWLRSLRVMPEPPRTVAIAIQSSEVPAAVLAVADLVVDGPVALAAAVVGIAANWSAGRDANAALERARRSLPRDTARRFTNREVSRAEFAGNQQVRLRSTP